MADRNSGNPNTRPGDREAGRVGRPFTPGDVPAQRGGTETPVILSGAPVASYTLGIPRRPHIAHDNGFLALGSRQPTLSDRARLAKWLAMLEGAEALRPDLVDGLGAYRHFLFGDGADRQFSYERYVANDSSGRITLENAMYDIKLAATEIWFREWLQSFSITGTRIGCGSSPAFPYPATENWQKAIGAHYIWLSADVKVLAPSYQCSFGEAVSFEADVTLHAEDRYNFNPGAQDIATGIPDQDNGIFEMTGMAHQYTNYATLKRRISWNAAGLGNTLRSDEAIGRQRQPSDNRRVRNNI